jgi:hypothetical protein
MINYIREISTSFQEYNDKYDELLKAYLGKHEDFSEIYFVEQEFEFYSKCYYSANITESSDEAGNLFYSVNNGIMPGLIAEIYESLRGTTSNANDGWDLERSNIYKATFKRIMNFLEFKKNQLKAINKFDSLLANEKFGANNLIGNCNENEVPPQNNIVKSTIEDYLDEFKDDIKHDGYARLVDALYHYFTEGNFPILTKKIEFKRINKKKVGWALKELYKSEKMYNLHVEYFRFAQQNINLFEKEVIATKDFNKSNFYKLFTTNPSK